MPIAPTHKKKKKTNIAIFLTVIGICAIIFGITIIKMKGI